VCVCERERERERVCVCVLTVTSVKKACRTDPDDFAMERRTSRDKTLVVPSHILNTCRQKHTHADTHAETHTRRDTHTHTHTRTHTHTHTHTSNAFNLITFLYLN